MNEGSIALDRFTQLRLHVLVHVPLEIAFLRLQVERMIELAKRVIEARTQAGVSHRPENSPSRSRFGPTSMLFQPGTVRAGPETIAVVEVRGQERVACPRIA